MDAARARLVLLGLAWLGFVSLGLPDGLLGVAWPAMRRGFALEPSALGALLVAATAGYVAASAASGWLLRRMNVGTLLAASCLATGAALLGYAHAPRFAAVVAFGGLAGLGAGAIDAGVNAWVALQQSRRAANLLHACYGIGAAAGPAIMGAVLAAGSPWTRGYAIVGVAQLALALAFAATRARWSAPLRAAPAQRRAPPGFWTTALGAAAFFVYTGIEAAAGAWSYSLLAEGRGLAMSVAAGAVSAFWGGLALGRVLAGALAESVPARALLRGSFVGMGLGAWLLWWAPFGGAGPLGLALLGLAAGPVFPTLIASTPLRVGSEHSDAAIGWQVAGAALGQAALPALLGFAIAALGVEAVGPALCAGVLALLALHEALERVSRGRAPTQAPGAPSREPDAGARAGSPR